MLAAARKEEAQLATDAEAGGEDAEPASSSRALNARSAISSDREPDPRDEAAPATAPARPAAADATAELGHEPDVPVMPIGFPAT